MGMLGDPAPQNSPSTLHPDTFTSLSASVPFKWEIKPGHPKAPAPPPPSSPPPPPRIRPPPAGIPPSPTVLSGGSTPPSLTELKRFRNQRRRSRSRRGLEILPRDGCPELCSGRRVPVASPVAIGCSRKELERLPGCLPFSLLRLNRGRKVKAKEEKGEEEDFEFHRPSSVSVSIADSLSPLSRSPCSFSSARESLSPPLLQSPLSIYSPRDNLSCPWPRSLHSRSSFHDVSQPPYSVSSFQDTPKSPHSSSQDTSSPLQRFPLSVSPFRDTSPLPRSPYSVSPFKSSPLPRTPQPVSPFPYASPLTRSPCSFSSFRESSLRPIGDIEWATSRAGSLPPPIP
ncbi:hypothetical protein AMTRI_Chr03g147110 [Amborella trichopoda]